MGPRHLSRGIEPGGGIVPTILGTASMGPRHLSRGIAINRTTGLPLVAGFNGATASEPWNRVAARPRTK